MNIWQFFADRLFEFFAVLLLGSKRKKPKMNGTTFFVTSLRLSVINFHKIEKMTVWLKNWMKFDRTYIIGYLLTLRFLDVDEAKTNMCWRYPLVN